VRSNLEQLVTTFSPVRAQLESPWSPLKCTGGATVVLAVMGRKVRLSLLTLGSHRSRDLFRP